MAQHLEDKKQNMRQFIIDEPQFNMDTYFGRMMHFFTILNPMNSFYTNAQIGQMQRTLED